MNTSLMVVFRNATGGGGPAYAVREFSGVPTVAPALIVIHAGDSGASAEAARLWAELDTVLLGSSPTAACTERVEVAADPTLLREFSDPARQKLLVLVVDGPVQVEAWWAAWLPTKPDRKVLTVFAMGASPTLLLPNAALQALNAQFWKRSVTEAMPAILSLSGLTLEDQRVFISYRRLEAQPLAEQLFDALTHEGLDVFLDRFSIHPGLNFQLRLTQELADKSMVLLIESAHIEDSPWTEHEIQFTKRYQLGLLALKLPDRVEPLGWIDVDQRIDLEAKQFAQPVPAKVANPQYAPNSNVPATYAQWGALTEETLREVVLAVKSVHDQALFRRRRFLRSNVEGSLRHAGLEPSSAGPDGLIRVSSKGVNYALWLTPRPPELVDFHTTHGRVATSAGIRGVVIGPTAALEPGRMEKLMWLKTLCGMKCIDQDDMAAAGALMEEGKL